MECRDGGRDMNIPPSSHQPLIIVHPLLIVFIRLARLTLLTRGRGVLITIDRLLVKVIVSIAEVLLAIEIILIVKLFIVNIRAEDRHKHTMFIG